jgi:hypothetical protein
MADIDVALLVSLYVVLLQALSEVPALYSLENNVVMESSIGGVTNLDS